ncbi:hypothetical protein OEZ86_005065 [Tetradesmus obliquus]|nr:hypothetical protein OEZ86_005065 [Tetradesmus obliquus]
MGNTSSTRRYVLYGAAGAATYLWLRSGSSRRATAADSTDFDSFLRAPAPATAQTTGGTTFESFLREQPEQPASTDFASFLRNTTTSSSSAQPAGKQQQAASKPVEVIPETAVPVLVLYGTEYGFAREIAEKLSQQLKDSGRFWPSLVNAAHHPEGYDLAGQQAALLCFSTQGDGVPPTEAREFCEWLTAGKAGPLPGLPYSVCALGDTSYTHFCRCGKQLDAALAAAGASPLQPRADVDKEDWAKVDAWIAGALAGLGELAAAGSLKSFAELGGVPNAATSGSAEAAAAAAAAGGRFSKSRPYYARVAAVEGLCVLQGPDDKDTVRLELELGPDAASAGGLAYLPGDALGIWPSNPPQAVDELLQQLGATGDEAVPTPSWHYAEDPQHSPAAAAADGSFSLRHALSVCYDIKTPKAQQLLTLLLAQQQQQQQQQQQGAAKPAARVSIDVLADASTAADLAAAGVQQQDANTKQPDAAAAAVVRLQGLLADGWALEQYLAARHVADVLQDYSQAQLSYSQLLPLLRPLQPRLYSISSSPLEGAAVQATIAVVRYTSLGKPRQGVASSQVGERLEPGQVLPVFISKNPDFRLPEDLTTPIIMVGPGTGLAPFRAFIQQRLLQQQQQGEGAGSSSSSVGPMHLFFGCRRRDQDFLYGQQLQAWHEAGAITLHTAFSRESGQKVYVQQRLREAGQTVWQLLQAGGHFYVCGDAGSMAGAVEAALLDIIREGQPERGAEGAAAYLQQLADAGRYERDVWFS